MFLDVDGVLLPFPRDDDDDDDDGGGKVHFPDRCLSALCRIMNSFKDSKIVLSSTWRCDPVAIEILLNNFRRYAKDNDRNGKVLGQIEEITLTTNLAMHSIRQHEIVDFVQRNLKKKDAWIALDDDESVGADKKYKHITKGRYIETISSKGLTMDDAEQAIQLLKAQLKSSCEDNVGKKKKRRRKI